MFNIVRREEMADGTVVLNEVFAPMIARKAKPGQFVIIKANEKGERIPLTMANTDIEQGTVTIIYHVVGKSTDLFKSLKVGDAFQDVIGPLGKPTHIEKIGTVVCVGGGTAVAVLYPIAKAFKQIGNNVISIMGSRNKGLLIMEDQMKAVSDELHVCTDDGSYGHHGFVTDVMKEVLKSMGVNLVVGIGPIPMMKFVCNITKEFNVKTLVSLNTIMIDGTGMCGCCRAMVGGEIKFSCVDGPEFDGHQVDFDGLMQRLQAYTGEEKESYEKHKCKLEK